MAVVDVADPSWGRLNSDRSTLHKFQGWLMYEGLDPAAIHKIEIYDAGSPFPEHITWARVYRRTAEGVVMEDRPITTIPPLHVLCIPGIWRTWPCDSSVVEWDA